MMAAEIGPTVEWDMQSYQQFWETVEPALMAQYQGKCVAMEKAESGWRIVQADDDLDELCKSIKASGYDLNEVVLDRVHREDTTAAGVELQ